jgi:hypothetical protein
MINSSKGTWGSDPRSVVGLGPPSPSAALMTLPIMAVAARRVVALRPANQSESPRNGVGAGTLKSIWQEGHGRAWISYYYGWECVSTTPGILGRLSQKASPATKLPAVMPREAALPSFSFIVTPRQTAKLT